jgi:hypothetical protein
MMGRQHQQPELFYTFQLERYVIDAIMDLGAMRQALQSYYSATGRPSVDPELMIRMLLIGYASGIRSERRLCAEVHLNMASRCPAAWVWKAMSLITRPSRRIGMDASERATYSVGCSRM